MSPLSLSVFVCVFVRAFDSILTRNNRHVIVTDNYFSSIPLAEHLHDKGLGFIGTLQTSRQGVPKSLKAGAQKAERGEHDWLSKGSTTVTAWRDKKPVFFLSTACAPGSCFGGFLCISLPCLSLHWSVLMCARVRVFAQRVTTRSKQNAGRWQVDVGSCGCTPPSHLCTTKT